MIKMNQIYNMDCQAGMKEMIENNIKADLIVTDPPYLIKGTRRKKPARPVCAKVATGTRGLQNHGWDFKQYARTYVGRCEETQLLLFLQPRADSAISRLFRHPQQMQVGDAYMA